MNRIRNYKTELFTILEIPERDICERQLSGFLLEFMNKQRVYTNDGRSVWITLSPKMQALTGLTRNRLILTQDYKKHIDWWDFVGLVSRRWKA